jgi:hypothetical protein
VEASLNRTARRIAPESSDDQTKLAPHLQYVNLFKTVLTPWELCMFRNYASQLRSEVVQVEEQRRHNIHLLIDREIASTIPHNSCMTYTHLFHRHGHHRIHLPSSFIASMNYSTLKDNNLGKIYPFTRGRDICWSFSVPN